MTARPEVVALLNDLRPGSLTHKDGQPFTADEIGTVLTATAYERVEAAEAWLLSPECNQIFTPNTPWALRICSATALDLGEVQEILKRRAAAEPR